MMVRSTWGRVAVQSILLLAQLAALGLPLALVLIARRAEAVGSVVPAWADVTRPETLRGLAAVYAGLVGLLILERWPRGTGWPWGHRGATMAGLGPALVSAPPAAVPEGSANEKGSASNGRQVTEGDAEEESAKAGGEGQEDQVASPLG